MLHHLRIATVALLTATALFAPTRRAASDTPYFSTTVDELTVVANGSAKRCSRIAAQFVQFDTLMRDLAAWDPETRLPALKVFLISPREADSVFLSDADRKRQDKTRMYIYSKYMPGTEFDIAAMLDEESYEEWMQSLFFLRAERLLIAGAARRYPAWYQIGVANLLNGLVIKDDGTIIFNRYTAFLPQVDGSGGPRLKLDLRKLLALTRTNDLKSQSDWQEFYKRARDWATYGILTTPERKEHFRDLALLMRQGTPADEAVKAAFGVSLEELSATFSQNDWRKEVQFRRPPPSTLVVVPESVRLSDGDAKLQLQIVAQRVAAAPPN